MSISVVQRQSGRPVPAPHGPATARSIGYLWPAALLIYSALLPSEIRLTISEQTIYPTRMAALALLPWTVSRISAGAFRFRALDAFMFAGTAWMIVSFLFYYNISEGFERSVPLAFDVIMPYLIARLSIRTLTDLRRLLILLAPGLLAAGLSMAIESVVKVPLIKPFAAKIFSPLSVYANGEAVGSLQVVTQTRLGLMRAAGPFSHPILGGIFLASFLPLYIYSGVRKWPKYAGLVGAGCGFFSLSTGAFLVYLIGLGVMLTDYVQRRLSFVTWRHIILFGMIAALSLEVLSKNGLVPVIIRYTLDPQTGYYRILIWEYGTASVMKHPWIGIGYTDFERASWMVTTIDNHWLLLAVRHGVVASLALLFAYVAAIMRMTGTVAGARGVDRATLIALAGVLTALVVAGTTVTYFGQMPALIYFLLGVGINQAAFFKSINRSER